MSRMLKSSGAMAAATMTSRVLGLVREIVYASFMGVGMVAGAFQLAFQIPNLFRRLLGEGALTASFIPIFKEKQRTAAREEMWRSANAVISGLLAVASLLSLLAMLALTAVLHYGPYERELPPGFAPADFKDLSALAKKLTDHDTPALAYLWQRISEPTRLALSTVGEVRTPSRE